MLDKTMVNIVNPMIRNLLTNKPIIQGRCELCGRSIVKMLSKNELYTVEQTVDQLESMERKIEFGGS
jgi:hypothetical protein